MLQHCNFYLKAELMLLCVSRPFHTVESVHGGNGFGATHC